MTRHIFTIPDATKLKLSLAIKICDIYDPIS